MKKLSCVILALALVLSLAACGSGSPSASPASPPAADKTSGAYALSDLYESNKDEAEKSITGKVIEITGTVEKVSGSVVYLDRESTMGYIVCNMHKDSADYSGLQKGDTAVIVGTVTGETGHINVKDCFYITD